MSSGVMGRRKPYKARKKQLNYARARRCKVCELVLSVSHFEARHQICKVCSSGSDSHRKILSMHAKEQAKVAEELAKFDDWSRKVREAAGVPK